METISISVQFEFNLREKPIGIEEMFMVLQKTEREVGCLLAQELCKRLETTAERALKTAGYVRHSVRARTLQGVIGTVQLRLLRMKAPDGTLHQALDESVTIPTYVRHTKDSFESAIGLLPHVSYKRSAVEGQRIVGHGPGKSTVHRQVEAWAPDLQNFPSNQAKGFRYLVADGTGAFFQQWVQFQKPPVVSYAGEMRLVLASQGKGQPFIVVGRWTNTSWADIAREVYQRIEVQDVQLLISDGEIGIEEAFLRSHMQHQRCTVHAWRDLKHFLYEDGAKKKAQEPIRQALSQLSALQFNQKTMEALQPIDQEYVERSVQESERQLQELVRWLYNKGYHKTARYLDNLKQPLLTFLHSWLQTGDTDPATSNAAENRMSLIKNRIVRIGRRWSEPGLKRWIDLAIHKVFPGYNWQNLWEKLLPLTGNLTYKITVMA